jgi:hypothetical protein
MTEKEYKLFKEKLYDFFKQEKLIIVSKKDILSYHKYYIMSPSDRSRYGSNYYSDVDWSFMLNQNFTTKFWNDVMMATSYHKKIITHMFDYFSSDITDQDYMERLQSVTTGQQNGNMFKEYIANYFVDQKNKKNIEDILLDVKQNKSIWSKADNTITFLINLKNLYKDDEYTDLVYSIIENHKKLFKNRESQLILNNFLHKNINENELDRFSKYMKLFTKENTEDVFYDSTLTSFVININKIKLYEYIDLRRNDQGYEFKSYYRMLEKFSNICSFKVVKDELNFENVLLFNTKVSQSDYSFLVESKDNAIKEQKFKKFLNFYLKNYEMIDKVRVDKTFVKKLLLNFKLNNGLTESTQIKPTKKI